MILHVVAAILVAAGIVAAFAAYVASFGCVVALFDEGPTTLRIAGTLYVLSPALFCLFMAGWTAT